MIVKFPDRLKEIIEQHIFDIVDDDSGRTVDAVTRDASCRADDIVDALLSQGVLISEAEYEEQRHPALVRLEKRIEKAVEVGYTRGDVNHVLQPIIGTLRQRQTDGYLDKLVDDDYTTYMIEKLDAACRAEQAWLSTELPDEVAWLRELLSDDAFIERIALMRFTEEPGLGGAEREVRINIERAETREMLTHMVDALEEHGDEGDEGDAS